MKYRAMRQRAIMGIFLGWLMIGGITYVVVSWTQTTIMGRLFFSGLLFLGITNLLYFYLQISKYQTYALIKDDGIHIYSKKQEELAAVEWINVQDCQMVIGEVDWSMKATYMMLIMRREMTFCDMPIASYHGYPAPNWKMAKPYVLDELMERLSMGKMSFEQFQSLPLLLLIVNSKQEYEKYQKMWHRKFNGIPGPGESSRGA